MSYGLFFSEDFVLDADPDAIRPAARPTCVYQAILSMRMRQWRHLARDVFHTEPKNLDPLTVLDQVRRTDTCSNLDSPVRVWIDAVGDHALYVYDRLRE